MTTTTTTDTKGYKIEWDRAAGHWQVRKHYPDMGLWFDVGDPCETIDAARTKLVQAAAGWPDPAPGDVVEFTTDEYYAAVAGQRAVIDGTRYDPDHVMAVLNWMTPFWGLAGAGQPTDDDPGYVSVSGGPCPAIFVGHLVYAGTTRQQFWHWGPRGRCAGGNVDYVRTVNLWRWDARPGPGPLPAA